jgi:transposase
VMTAKYADGTPLYRMEDALGRSNIAVSRGTLAHWIIRPAELHLSRLYEALRGTLLAQSLIHGDETTVQVLKEDGKSAPSKSYMWVYRSAEASAEPVVLFEYQPGRGQQYPQAFLKGYAGTLMTDGYSAWRTLEGVTHLGCLAHARPLRANMRCDTCLGPIRVQRQDAIHGQSDEICSEARTAARWAGSRVGGSP